MRHQGHRRLYRSSSISRRIIHSNTRNIRTTSINSTLSTIHNITNSPRHPSNRGPRPCFVTTAAPSTRHRAATLFPSTINDSSSINSTNTIISSRPAVVFMPHRLAVRRGPTARGRCRRLSSLLTVATCDHRAVSRPCWARRPTATYRAAPPALVPAAATHFPQLNHPQRQVLCNTISTPRPRVHIHRSRSAETAILSSR